MSTDATTTFGRNRFPWGLNGSPFELALIALLGIVDVVALVEAARLVDSDPGVTGFLAACCALGLLTLLFLLLPPPRSAPAAALAEIVALANIVLVVVVGTLGAVILVQLPSRHGWGAVYLMTWAVLSFVATVRLGRRLPRIGDIEGAPSSDA